MNPGPVLLCLMICTLGVSGQLYDALFRNLMRGYQKDVMPRASLNSTISVKFNVMLIKIIEMSLSNQYLKTDVWMSTSWQDPRLTWDPAQHHNIQKLAIPPNRLWTPDLMLYNGASSIRTASVRAVVYSDGNILLIHPGTIRSRCEVYPDREPTTCVLKFGSWVHSGSELDLRFQTEGDHKVDVSEYVQSLDYDIINNTATRNVVTYDCCPEPYIDLTFSLTIREVAEKRRRRRRR